MLKEFEGKVALVAGASSGLGRTCALAFARRGAKVVVAGVQVEAGRETVRLIDQAFGKGAASFIKCNISNSAEVGVLMQAVDQIHGRLDFACHNAGIQDAPVFTTDYAEDIWNQVINVNLTGVWMCMKYEIPLMIRSGGGVIVNMASPLGLAGFSSAWAQAACHYGLVGLTRTAAVEYAHRGIRVNAVCPVFVDSALLTPSGVREDVELYALNTGLSPFKQAGTPEELAEAVTWLCSDAAGFTGHAMVVEGSSQELLRR